MPDRQVAPTKLFLAITNRCNVMCKHCMPDSREAMPGELATDCWLKIIDGAAALGVPRIAFTGGEPTLHPDLDRLIAHAALQGIRVDLETSASLYREGMIRHLIEKGLQVLCLSLDSPNAQGHEAFRGVPRLFDKVLGAAGEAVAAGIDVRIYTTVTRSNIDIVLTVADLFHDFEPPIRGLTFAPLSPIGRGAAISADRPSVNQWREFCVAFEAKRQEMRGRPNMRIEPMYASKEDLANLVGAYPQDILCIARERRYMYVNPQGKAYGCSLLAGSDAHLGNLSEQDITCTWIESPNWDFFNPRSACDSNHACGGGCPALAYRTTGDRNGVDYRCEEVSEDLVPICPMVQVPMIDVWPELQSLEERAVSP